MEDGCRRYSFFVPEPGSAAAAQARYLIVVGTDLSACTMQDYADGGCDPGEERQASARMERYETTRADVLAETLALYEQDLAGAHGGEMQALCGALQLETRLSLAAAMLYAHGPLARQESRRWDLPMLEDVYAETYGGTRLFYLAVPVTVPARGSAEITVYLTQDASYDYHTNNARQGGAHGYDFVTQAGTALTFTDLTVSVDTRGQVEILDQNLGLDPENGTAEAVLDPAQERYYLVVRRVVQTG